MLSDVSWPEDRSYLSGTDHSPYEFYANALLNSNRMELLLGYFSSSAISALSFSFASFLSKGGTVKMVINDVLSEKDKSAIVAGLDISKQHITLDISDFNNLKEQLDNYGTHFFDCIAWLIANNKIELQVVKPKFGKGIAHYKSGVFFDGRQSIGFKASCNFTSYGLLENLEELEIYLSWENGRSNKFIKKRTEFINSIFKKEVDFLEYLEVKDIREAILTNFGNKDENELLVQEADLLKQKRKFEKQALETQNARDNLLKIAKEPAFPYKEGPRSYQLEAYANWEEHNFKGMFAMATGTGKTLTSLNCLLNRYNSDKHYRAVIIVPTLALVDQWKKECLDFNFSEIVLVSSKVRWEDQLAFINTRSIYSDSSFIIIVTYASFPRKKFQEYFNQLPADTLIIADEAHNLGSPQLIKILPKIHLQKRIGLSATPDRKYDELGNTAIETFFDDKPPFVYRYTMEMAMENGWLCPYTYYPHVVYLTTEETEEYIKISLQLLIYFDSITGGYKKCIEVDNLLLKRKRIVHKAFNKKAAFKKIVHDEFALRGNLKYTLVYVPEGLEPDYDDRENLDYGSIEEFIESSEEVNLIDEYTRILSQTDYSIMVNKYTANTPDRPSVIKKFQSGELDVLTSMKCLDEGVDVPRSELAIFCASTGNPRQFIQRRGRVLRLHPQKTHAVIHDLVVVPSISDNDSTYNMERSLIRKELERVVDFSRLSKNKSDTYKELKDVLDYYNLNLNDFEIN
jgi:superfamily II DNA or RNA helicase